MFRGRPFNVVSLAVYPDRTVRMASHKVIPSSADVEAAAEIADDIRALVADGLVQLANPHSDAGGPLLGRPVDAAHVELGAHNLVKFVVGDTVFALYIPHAEEVDVAELIEVDDPLASAELGDELAPVELHNEREPVH
jgi:hypothetical protein